jgi:signal peptidase I
MTPTIVDRQMIVMERYWSGCYPDRMDIVVIKSSEDGETLNKRILGMPNEIFEAKEGIVYIDGKRMNDPYVTTTREFSIEPIKIPKDCYFVIGDNRGNSLYGIFHRREIWGIVIYF